jgi:hypothetical protein
MKTTHECPHMFGIKLYDKRYLTFNKRERQHLSRTVRMIQAARMYATEDSYLDLELAGIEGRIEDLLEFEKVDI